MIYEHYGRTKWMNRLAFCSQADDNSPELTAYEDVAAQRQASEKGPSMSGDRSKQTSLAEMLTFLDTSSRNDARSGNDETAMLSKQEEQALFQQRLELQMIQRSLAFELNKGDISRVDYLKQLGWQVDAFLEFGLHVMGEDRFKAVFGDRQSAFAGLIDRETFLQGEDAEGATLPHQRAAGE